MQDPQGRALMDYNGSSGAIQNWYAFGSGPNDVLNQVNLTGSTRATYIPDIQGSVVGALDASSGALTKAGYQTYGESGTTAGTFRYTGARIDAETNGLYDFRARIYSPVLGRFLQTDPIGTAGGVNLYAYVGNDPLNGLDPSGLYTLQIGFAGSGNFFGISVPAGLGIAIDTSGHVGFYSYLGPAVNLGASVDAGLSIQVSNAQTISNLTGAFLNASAHGGVGFGGSVDYFRGPSDNGQVSGVGVTVGSALGASVTAGVTNTFLYAPFGDGAPTNPSTVTSAGAAAQQVDTDLQSTPNPGSLAGSSPSGTGTSSTPGK
jgi:RHS repeat-associated protein